MLKYPEKLSRDTNDTILVEFPDVPEAHTFGEDADEALMRRSGVSESGQSPRRLTWITRDNLKLSQDVVTPRESVPAFVVGSMGP